MNARLCCVMIISILQYAVQTFINDHCRYAGFLLAYLCFNILIQWMLMFINVVA